MTTYRSRKDGSHYPISKRRTTGTFSKGTAHLSVPKRITSKETNLNRLLGEDFFARQAIDESIKSGRTVDDALRIYVNSVEGDTSQLPKPLVTYAKKKV
jgi:hypothetical protein